MLSFNIEISKCRNFTLESLDLDLGQIQKSGWETIFLFLQSDEKGNYLQCFVSSENPTTIVKAVIGKPFTNFVNFPQ